MPVWRWLCKLQKAGHEMSFNNVQGYVKADWITTQTTRLEGSCFKIDNRTEVLGTYSALLQYMSILPRSIPIHMIPAHHGSDNK
jgi:hypothetical protein